MEMKWQIQILLSWLIIGRPAEDNKMPSRGQQLGKLLNPTGDIVETSLPPKIETFSQSVSNTGKIEKAALGNDVSTIEQVSDVSLLAASGNTVGDQRVVGNNLYIWNGSGWFRIALINETPTWDSGGQPAGAYVLDADSPQTATSITLAATDPDGFPISYSYVTGGSMDSIATISQDSSVFTITPKTSVQAPDGGTGSITFRATDGVNILPQVSSFTLNFATTAENSRYTTLLVTATGTSDNNNITDSSSNNHSITVNGGDVHAGTFSPYRSGGYSTYFDGTSGIFSDPSTGTTLQGVTTFTVEFWYNTKTVTTGNKVIWGSRNYSSNSNTDDTIGRMFQTGGSLYYTVNGSTVVQLNSVISADTWYYIALVVDSGALSLYIDGIRVGTATYTSPNGSDTITVSHTANTPQQYIADFRITTAAEYSGTNHTVPTESLPKTLNTIFHLTKGYFDEWVITHLGTNFTTPVITPFSPYDYNEYSATDHGGSIYFDGTGDNLQLPSVLPAGAFTVSCWVYFNTEDASAVWAQGTSGNAGRTSVQMLTSRRLFFAIGGTNVTSGQGDISPKSWYYIEAQYSGSQIELFINGFSVGTASTTTNPQNTNFHVGTLGSAWDSSYELDGYVSDLKVVSGTPSGTSTVPTAPLSSSGAELHLKGTDASIIDKSQSRNIKITNNITSTTQTKFANTRSIYFDGTYAISMGESLILKTLNTPFTGELWFYPTNVAGGGRIIAQADNPSAGRFWLNLETDGRIRFYWQGASDLYSTNSVSDNQWHHIAFVRKSNGYLAIYVDGTETELAQDNNNRATDNSLTRIGSSGPSYFPSYIQGYIQDVRLTNGLARYTANFTPPTAPLEG
jgi:hypothetical protein